MRRKDFAAAVEGVAGAVRHAGMSLDDARAKLSAICDAGFMEPGDPEQVIGRVGAEPAPAEEAESTD